MKCESVHYIILPFYCFLQEEKVLQKGKEGVIVIVIVNVNVRASCRLASIISSLFYYGTPQVTLNELNHYYHKGETAMPGEPQNLTSSSSSS